MCFLGDDAYQPNGGDVDGGHRNSGRESLGVAAAVRAHLVPHCGSSVYLPALENLQDTHWSASRVWNILGREEAALWLPTTPLLIADGCLRNYKGRRKEMSGKASMALVAASFHLEPGLCSLHSPQN